MVFLNKLCSPIFLESVGGYLLEVTTTLLLSSRSGYRVGSFIGIKREKDGLVFGKFLDVSDKP